MIAAAQVCRCYVTSSPFSDTLPFKTSARPFDICMCAHLFVCVSAIIAFCPSQRPWGQGVKIDSKPLSNEISPLLIHTRCP
jgi:hypothetical protein